jgi:phosphonoacetaldehyde hydrolase
LFGLLGEYAERLPGVKDCAEYLRAEGIPIGSTTGYTTEMMGALCPRVRESGYSPDSMVCPDGVGNVGRPYPYMLWRNLKILKVKDVRRVIKAGDTVSDVEEGKNAGCFTVGVLEGSSMLGLSMQEVRSMPEAELNRKKEIAARQYYSAGADMVLNDISELPRLIRGELSVDRRVQPV